MRALLVAVALMAMIETPDVVCRAGTSTAWVEDLAGIEARYQAEQARMAGRAFPGGAPIPSSWSWLAQCAEGGVL